VTSETNSGWSRICAAESLIEQGDGIRFVISPGGAPIPAFLLRIDGIARAYLNRCAHVPVELDWNEGKFLDHTGRSIVCATHGAVYDAASGRCQGGPCRGRGLQPVACREIDGWIEVEATVGRIA
jgi:nitrite reductase/ring-hydroxylating ferredoxin subunit